MRCGRCRHVFNGYETVSVGPDLPEAEVAVPPAVAARRRATPASWWQKLPGMGPRRAPPAAGRASSTVRTTPSANPPSAMRAEGLSQMVELVRNGPDPSQVEPGALRVRPAHGMELERRPDDFGLGEAARRRTRGVAFGAVLLLGLPVLAMVERAPIIQFAPGLHAVYETLCRPFACSVPLPADAEAWSIESNELREEPAGSQQFHFTATLRNRSHYTQAFPNLDLSLTDVEGLPVERLVFQPNRYLPATRKAEQGLLPNAEVAIRVDLQARDRRSQGYRLVVFFP